jgi:pyruvate/2-oxoglutarate dehydrogenase complex dihydrolipoamide dehydrogenase (E3) component
VIFGAGKFVDPQTLSVDGRDIRAQNFVLATGSRPAVPPIGGLERISYLSNETVFDLSEPVPSLLVLGGGPIGVELAQAFCRLGSRVQVIEARSRILDKDDADLARVVHDCLAPEGVEFHLDQKVERIEQGRKQIRLLTTDNRGGERWLEGGHRALAQCGRARSGRRRSSDAGWEARARFEAPHQQ